MKPIREMDEDLEKNLLLPTEIEEPVSSNRHQRWYSCFGHYRFVLLLLFISVIMNLLLLFQDSIRPKMPLVSQYGKFKAKTSRGHVATAGLIDLHSKTRAYYPCGMVFSCGQLQRIRPKRLG